MKGRERKERKKTKRRKKKAEREGGEMESKLNSKKEGGIVSKKQKLK